MDVQICSIKSSESKAVASKEQRCLQLRPGCEKLRHHPDHFLIIGLILQCLELSTGFK